MSTTENWEVEGKVKAIYHHIAWTYAAEGRHQDAYLADWSPDFQAEELAKIYGCDKHLLGGFIVHKDEDESFARHKHEPLDDTRLFLPTSWFNGKPGDLRHFPGLVVYDHCLGREVYFWSTTGEVGTIVGYKVELEDGSVVEVTEPGVLEVFDFHNPASPDDVPRRPNLKLVKA